MASPLQQKLEVEAKAFQQFQNDHSKMVNTLSKLGSQLNENDMVLKELELVDDEAKIFKLIGPVLIKQDLDEAKANVEKRLQYIKDEMKRTQTHMTDLDKKMEEKKEKIVSLQQQAQQAQKPKGQPQAVEAA